MERSKTLLSLAVLLAVGLAQCRPSGQPPSVHSKVDDGTKTSRESKQYRGALKTAIDNAAKDELGRTLNSAERITLSGSDIQSLSRLRIAENGSLLLLDFDRAVAELYDGSGRFVRSIGSKGSSPGNYEWPSGIAQRKDGSIAICDFRVHRVNLYSAEGGFLRSFIYSPQVFSAQQMVYDSQADSFYLYGNRWQNDPSGKAVGADLIHKYSAAGEFLGSQLPFPDQGKPLNLYAYDDPAIDIASGSLYVALPFGYTVYRLTADKRASPFIADTPRAFRPPSTEMSAMKKSDLDPSELVQEWLLTWTPINALLISQDRLFLQYQTFSPLRYTIDTWSLTSGKRLATRHTNHEMMARDQEGYIYFLDNVETRGQQKYELLRAKTESL